MGARFNALLGSFGRHTAEEIRAIAGQDGSVLVIPVGSIEQHGTHLPVATDTLLAASVTTGSVDELVENEDVPALVAPPIWSGFSPHHLTLGGTLSAGHDTLVDVLSDVAETGAGNGFDAVLFVNGHGGNIPIVDVAVSVVGDDHPEIEVLGVTYFTMAGEFIDEIRDSSSGGMAHGGEFETSLMLHLYPDLVGEEREGEMLEEPYEAGITDMFEGSTLSVYRTFDEYAEDGAIGAPEHASAEKGKEIYEKLLVAVSEMVRSIHERNA